jgi:hypothetical protein
MIPLFVLLAMLLALYPSRFEARDLCSLALLPSRRPVNASVLLASASPDTIAAGPGHVISSGDRGHFGSGAPGPIYGQVFTVARFGGADSTTLARAFQRRRDTRVVIVPWDYDPACKTTRWTRGFAWVPIAKPGTFMLKLRPDSLWADGLPVFDVFVAEFQPYPLSPAYVRILQEIQPRRAMSAEQYFELLSAMPTDEDRYNMPDSAWVMFARWQATRADLASLYPASEIAEELASDVIREKGRRLLLSIQPTIAGTYRMSFSLNDGGEKQFYMRTRPRPLNTGRPNVPTPQNPLDEPAWPEQYVMLVSGASSLQTLAMDCGKTRAAWREGYISVLDPARNAPDPRTEWRGKIEVSLIARQFPEDSALAQFSRQQFDEWSARSDASRERAADARFWLDNDRILRVEQTIRLHDGRTLFVRGERVSLQIVDCAW